MAFYRVARMSDDVADHPTAPPEAKLARLAEIEATLKAEDDRVPEAVRLRMALAERGLDTTHILDLLRAFRRDVTKTRYADWADLMDYCRYSAAPVGRFMLDVHGESRATWPASDALVRGAAGDQPSAGLRQGLSRARPRLRAHGRPARRSASRPWPMSKASRPLRAAIGGLAVRTRDLLHVASRSARASKAWAWRWKSPPSIIWPSV